MDIKQEYREATNHEPYANEPGTTLVGSYCDEYVIWLENKIKALAIFEVVQAKPEVCECGETPLKEPHLFIEGKYRCKCGRAIAN